MAGFSVLSFIKPTSMKKPISNYEKLLELLHQGTSLTYKGAAERLGCNIRTIYRCLATARGEGIPLQVEREEGREHVISIPEEHRREGVKINLGDEEMLALAIAGEAAQFSLGPTPLGPALHSSIKKLLDRLPGEFYSLALEQMSEQWHFSHTPSAQLDPVIFKQLMHAVDNCETLSISYATAKRREPRERKIDPYGFAAPRGSWMVVAWCHRRKAFLNFSVADIRSIEVTGSNFIREEFDLDKHFAGHFGGVGGEKMYNVLFLVEPDRVAAFRRKQYHASQQLEEREDGRAIVHFTVAGLEDIRSFAQSWGTGITVLEPEELVEVMRDEANEILRRYKDKY